MIDLVSPWISMVNGLLYALPWVLLIALLLWLSRVPAMRRNRMRRNLIRRLEAKRGSQVIAMIDRAALGDVRRHAPVGDGG